MLIKSAKYIVSAPNLSGCPSPDFPEFAFIGRSNVGKSSLINMITGRRALARISVTPGKTQKINFFLINDSWYLVDLPGYGYAKRSKSARDDYERMVRTYLKGRDTLRTVFLLIDSRIKPQTSDLEFMSWLAESAIPFVLVFTKTDKLSRQALTSNLDHYRKLLEEEWEDLPTAMVSSAISHIGREEILALIQAYSAEKE